MTIFSRSKLFPTSDLEYYQQLEKHFLSKLCALALIYGILGNLDTQKIVLIALENDRKAIVALIDFMKDLLETHTEDGYGSNERLNKCTAELNIAIRHFREMLKRSQ